MQAITLEKVSEQVSVENSVEDSVEAMVEESITIPQLEQPILLHHRHENHMFLTTEDLAAGHTILRWISID
jgi:hypothetical protein